MHGLPSGLVFSIYYPILAAIGIPVTLKVMKVDSTGPQYNSYVTTLARCCSHKLIPQAETMKVILLFHKTYIDLPDFKCTLPISR
ncbi:hypothetical protein chiPu_0013054 [Chiloscyllium punctatum]|uniref:Uncharacterized protein n=1 Tax=Chiloscyllium punctatum TaxID=137246 RepID=A0A401SVZ8_CHIPU|nr:hypothetical protein [Chiloscyllium punctatum]